MPTEYYELSDPGVKAANTFSTVVTCILFAFSAKLATTTKTAFDTCSVLMVLPILLSDCSYWLTIAKVIPVPMNEPPRTMSLVLTCGLACALCCHRFRVFARAGLADWYTPRRSRLLVAFILVHTFISMCIMSISYWLQREHYPTGFPSSPFRKATQLAQFGVNMPIHLAFTFMTFRIVWDIREAVIRRKSVQNTVAGKGSGGKATRSQRFHQTRR
ncbi:hypothetical protein BCR44DRAFT_222728 [Catenaria anguillulae PL171]|uniref:Integral membrane protein n=1 Tax=Catenaria anguillulae PL171 TaxID=765915 RepID=A0A1Y2HA08_9FUNG|nr:hypothetical protein BCR44DRAFT_222728 [Catenaria anguillulae PL171]